MIIRPVERGITKEPFLTQHHRVWVTADDQYRVSAASLITQSIRGVSRQHSGWNTLAHVGCFFFFFYFSGCTDFIISHFEVTYLKKLSGQTSWSSFSCLLLLRVKSCFSHSHKLFLVIWFRFFATASPCVTSQHHISCQGVFEHLSVWLMRERWRPQTSVMLSDQHSSW